MIFFFMNIKDMFPESKSITYNVKKCSRIFVFNMGLDNQVMYDTYTQVRGVFNYETYEVYVTQNNANDFE